MDMIRYNRNIRYSRASDLGIDAGLPDDAVGLTSFDCRACKDKGPILFAWIIARQRFTGDRCCVNRQDIT